MAGQHVPHLAEGPEKPSYYVKYTRSVFSPKINLIILNLLKIKNKSKIRLKFRQARGF